MTDPDCSSYGAVIDALLRQPYNRKAFDGFFRLCYSHTVGYLRVLAAKGRQLPLEHKVVGDPVNDLAMDVLGTFLHSTRDQAFPVVFNYFRKVRIAEPGHTDPEKLYYHFSVLIRGYIRQEIYRLLGRQDPQIGHLKRRFKEILKSPDFATLKINSGSAEVVFLSANAYNLHHGKPTVRYIRSSGFS